MFGIEENNQFLDPKFYVQTKEKIKNQLELLEDIELPKKEKKIKEEQYLIDLQKYFMICFGCKVINATEKEEIKKLIYMFRYYNYIYLKENVQIKDEKQLYNERTELEEKLIQKAYELKIINQISSEDVVNFEIIKKILDTKIIRIENVNIQLEQNENSLEISIYDGDIYEDKIIIQEYEKKKMEVKFNKLIKVFN